MANVFNGNTIYIDSAGVAWNKKNALISYIVLTTSSSGDSITLTDNDDSKSLKIVIKNNTSEDTVRLNFSDKPLLFPNGINVSAISNNATATLVVEARQ